MKILVVDDDKAVCGLIAAFLSDDGCEVSCANSAEAGVELVKQELFDLIFLDYMMPGKDGEWFLRNAGVSRRTKIILITAHLTREVINLMFKLGISGYVTKPFGYDDIMRHLSFHLERKREDFSPA